MDIIHYLTTHVDLFRSAVSTVMYLVVVLLT